MIEISSKEELYSSLLNNTVSKAIKFPFTQIQLIKKCSIFYDFKLSQKETVYQNIF